MQIDPRGLPKRKSNQVTVTQKYKQLYKGDTEALGFMHISNTLHQAKSKNNKEEKLTIHRTPLFFGFSSFIHALPDEMVTFTSIATGS